MGEKTIEIDMDKPCTKCGQMGAGPGSVCISCASAAILDNGQMLIDEALISVWNQVKHLMALHSSQIRMAYHKAEEGKLSIGMTAEISPSEEVMNALKVRVKINFVESRIKDESMERVSLQEKLPI